MQLNGLRGFVAELHAFCNGIDFIGVGGNFELLSGDLAQFI